MFDTIEKVKETLKDAKLYAMNDPEFKEMTFGDAGNIMKALEEMEKIELIEACYILGYYSARH